VASFQNLEKCGFSGLVFSIDASGVVLTMEQYMASREDEW